MDSIPQKSLCTKCGVNPRRRSSCWCNACDAAYQRSRYNPDKRRRVNLRNNSRHHSSYPMEVEEYERLLAEQSGVCSICKQPETVKQKGKVVRLTIDHDHKTGKLRALLCQRCNRLLGSMERDIDLTMAILTYWEQYRGD